MTAATHSAADVAARYGHSKDYVLRLAREGRWPHLRVGRSVRFTDAHLAQIDVMHEVKASAATAAASWGRKTRRSA